MVIADNGRGMTPDGLVAAMRFGSDPRGARSATDLGRFGLGLKTASLSQASSVAVVTQFEGFSTRAARWDLDRMDTSTGWNLELGSPEDLGLRADEVSRPTGTSVFWENLDQLLGSAGTIDKLYAVAESVARHLGMTFHRLIERGQLVILVNDVVVPPWDPLATGLSESIAERRLVPGSISVRGCLLPSPEKLDEEVAARLAGPSDWLEQQGFYVYRQDRLLCGGGWLGLGRPGRPWRLDKRYNLARISVDLDNSQDESWSIDIKKSSARPPDSLQSDLYDLASKVRRRASARNRVAQRERAVVADTAVSLWLPGARGAIAFRLNRRHPLVSKVRNSMGDGTVLQSLLDTIERTAPVQGTRPPVASIDTVVAARKKQAEQDVERLVRTLYLNMRVVAGMSPTDARSRLMEYPEMREHESFIATLIEVLEREGRTDL